MQAGKGKRVVLHIGFHKTGSSAIQANLEQFSAEYAERGLVVPQGLSHWTGHPEIAWACCPEKFPWADRDFQLDELSEYYGQQLADLPEGATLLLSSEEYCRLNYYPGAIEAIRDFFEGTDLTILAYLRDPIDFLVSRYRHEITHGEATPLEPFMRHHLRSADLALRLRPWVDIFGHERVIARLFDRKAFTGGTIVNDFLGALAVTPEPSDFRRGEFSGAHPWLCSAWQKLNASDADEAMRDEGRRTLYAASIALPAVDAKKALLAEIDLGDLEDEIADMRSRLAAAVNGGREAR
ncbi:MAG: hypothetical protein KDH20_03545 [Rhodocyclaceae bacterium]|nr:hypothetical protein [Rhodocyclaceae bacterium]